MFQISRKTKFLSYSVPLFWGFASPALADWTRISSDTIQLVGDIQRSSYEEYKAVAASGYSRVRLKSFGGVPLVALKIAEDIAARKVEVIVDGYCFSSCANYLVLAGAQLTVPCGALIGWHGTPTLESDDEIRRSFAAKNYPASLTDTYLGWLNDFRKREQEFFKGIKVDHRILEDSVAIPIAEKLKAKVDYKFDSETGAISTITSQAPLWIPESKTLKKYGVQIEGFCTQYSRADIENYLQQRGFKFQVSSGDSVGDRN